MRKSLAALLLFLTISTTVFGQILKPISWKNSIDNDQVNTGDTVILSFQATIDEDWYLYSSDFDPNLGPMVTTIKIEENTTFSTIGPLTPVHPKKKYDDLWEGDITYFVGKAAFTQKAVVNASGLIKGTIIYQVCTEVDGKCIPLQEDFSFKVTASGEQSTINLAIEEEEGVLSFMLYAFLFGLAAIFTPCVFPMIPLTVSFFTKRAENKTKGKAQALFYGFSIIFIYTAFGAIVAPLAGPAFANAMSTHWLPNALFFIIFIFFALSFFGLFEIVLPSNLVNKMDQQSEKSGGLLGVFFMAFTLVLVSFSCTGPIVGSILVASAGGEILKPVAGMFAFSMAFALPFSIFALFPSLLKKMPKSGGWLNSVKVVLGFIELAFAFKFLSIIDQVYHLGILDREVNIAIWIGIALFLGMYLIGKLRLPHDSPMDSIPVLRMLLGLSSFIFAIYLIPGLFGAPLRAFSGFLPPSTTHDFDLIKIIRDQPKGTVIQTNTPQINQGDILYDDLFHLPHGLQGYFEIEQGLAAAKKQNKPLFIDFTGHGCVNCRTMEENVWVDQKVMRILQEEYIIVALYVDDRTELPKDKWITSNFDEKVKKTIGEINGNYQIEKFKNNAQPYYILMDHNQKAMVKPKDFDTNVDNFVKFLNDGLNVFKNK